MTSQDTPLQQDMFSGKLVDTRSRTQKKADNGRNDPKQMEMFRQRDLAQFGVRANPVMDLHPGRLQLISEDPRTPEEKERDLRRKAESMTKPMFAEYTDTPEPSEALPTPLQPSEQNTTATITTPATLPHEQDCPETAPPTRESVYLALVETAREQAITLWVDHPYERLFRRQLPIAMLHAVAEGLQSEEILTAIHIGECLGKSESVAHSAEANPQQNTPTPIKIPVDEEAAEPTCSTPRGFRARVRQENAPVRFR